MRGLSVVVETGSIHNTTTKVSVGLTTTIAKLAEERGEFLFAGQTLSFRKCKRVECQALKVQVYDAGYHRRNYYDVNYIRLCDIDKVSAILFKIHNKHGSYEELRPLFVSVEKLTEEYLTQQQELEKTEKALTDFICGAGASDKADKTLLPDFLPKIPQGGFKRDELITLSARTPGQRKVAVENITRPDLDLFHLYEE